VVNPLTGTKHALRQIPVGAVLNPGGFCAIAAGSEVDYEVLAEEIQRLADDGVKVGDRLVIDPEATILTPDNRDSERLSGLIERVGSTGKGIGQARADRALRRAPTVKRQAAWFEALGAQVRRVDALAYGGDWSCVQIEGTQGYGLGLHAGHYPQSTSSDCTAMTFLSMAQLSPWARWVDLFEVWVVFRPYPIRVAGNSGYLHGETTWDALGLEPEYTTVTKKMRRVGQWDEVLAYDAMRANGGPGGPVRVALTMADQIDRALVGATNPAQLAESALYGAFVRYTTPALGQIDLVTTSDRTCVDLRGEDGQA
jgi:adenylosuccinate synthase